MSGRIYISLEITCLRSICSFSCLATVKPDLVLKPVTYSVELVQQTKIQSNKAKKYIKAQMTAVRIKYALLGIWLSNTESDFTDFTGKLKTIPTTTRTRIIAVVIMQLGASHESLTKHIKAAIITKNIIAKVPGPMPTTRPL